MILGQIIRALRHKRNISLRNLAKKANISQAYLSVIETRAVVPSEKIIRVIAKELHANEDELLYRSGKLSSELTDIIMKCPKEFARVIRAMACFNPEQLGKMADALCSRKI